MNQMGTTVDGDVGQHSGNAIIRGLRAIFLERRLPYRVDVALNSVMTQLGSRTRIVRHADFRFCVRRKQGFALNTDEAFIQNILVRREYTPPGFEIEPRDTVIDIGGNIGTFAIMAAKLARNGRVFAFEPGSENFALLKRNAKLNAADNVSCFHLAVSDAAGSIRLNLAEDGGYHSTENGGGSAFETVECVSLRDIFDRNAIERCDFLKLDCEGAEYRILHALPDDYFGRIGKIAMEWHAVGVGMNDPEAKRRDIETLMSHLKARGFRIDAFEEFPPPFLGGHVRASRIQPEKIGPP